MLLLTYWWQGYKQLRLHSKSGTCHRIDRTIGLRIRDHCRGWSVWGTKLVDDMMFDEVNHVGGFNFSERDNLWPKAVVKMLYRRLYDGILLHCLSTSHAQKVIKEAHDDIYGHKRLSKRHMMTYMELIYQDQSSRIDCTNLAVIGQLWLPMQSNTQKRCKACQIHANFIHQPRNYSTPQSQLGHSRPGELI